MWSEAVVLSALSVGALLFYAGIRMSVGEFVRAFARGRVAEADEKARRRGASESFGAAFVRLCLALCLAALGALTLYFVGSRLRV